MSKIKLYILKTILFAYLFVRIQYLLVRNILTKPKKKSVKLHDDYKSIADHIKGTYGLSGTYEEAKEEWKKQFPENPPKIRDKQLKDILTLPEVEPKPYTSADYERLTKMRQFVEANRKPEDRPECAKMENIKKNQPWNKQ